jgi:hypothetical protein
VGVDGLARAADVAVALEAVRDVVAVVERRLEVGLEPIEGDADGVGEQELIDAAPLDERLRLSESGSHEREYVACQVDFTISVGSGASVDVEAETPDAADRPRAQSTAH